MRIKTDKMRSVSSWGDKEMRIHIMDLLPGDRLSKDIFNSYGLHVLSAQTVLDRESITKLLSHNIDYIDIERAEPRPDTSGSTLASFAAPTAQDTYSAGMTGVSLLFNQALADGKIDSQVVDATFEPLAESIKQEKNLVSLMLSLENGDDYTYQHSVQVGMLAFYMSQWLGYSQEFALDAGKAGFLHDIGKSMVDIRILNKPDKLTEEEFQEVRKHSEYGKSILEKSYPPDSLVVIGALQHHERLNGTGYPLGLKGDEIHPISRILAVADIYSAMICSRVYQKERDMLFVLRELHRLSFSELDPHITQVFIRNMVPNFIGKTVVLFNGERGIIVLTNPSDFFRPFIQLDKQFIDLSKHPELEILKIIM
jgi:putative nucleotidyltransferase with HDIG domain